MSNFLAVRVLAVLVAVAGLASGPLMAQCEQKFTAGDGSYRDHFGQALALTGDYALIGAPLKDRPWGSPDDIGIVYVFHRTPGGWVEEDWLQPDLSIGDYFGWSIAAVGGLAVIGAPYAWGNEGDAGAVFVYRFDGGVWVEDQRLIASDGGRNHRFGTSVAFDGDAIVVGANGADGMADGAGAAYVFRYQEGTGWQEEQKLTASDGEASEQFGYSVCVQGDVIAIGAIRDSNEPDHWGAVYLYRYDGLAWAEEQKVIQEPGHIAEAFGTSASLDGERLLIGALSPGPGSVHLYHYDGSRWTADRVVQPSDGARDDFFGHSVILRGTTAYVGAPRYNHDDCPFGSDCQIGAVYLYKDITATPLDEQKLTASDATAGSFLGWCLVLDDGGLLASAHLWDGSTGIEMGAAYEFRDAAWRNYGLGWPGTNGIPGLTALTEPFLGSTVTVELESSAGVPTTGWLLLGLDSASLSTPWEGTMLVAPALVLPLNIPASGVSLAGDVACEKVFAGVAVYLQVLELDSGASRGISFTPGLQLVLGHF